MYSLNSERDDDVCDATTADSSTTAGQQKTNPLKQKSDAVFTTPLFL